MPVMISPEDKDNEQATPEKVPNEFEDIFENLGSFGHWQRVIFVLICLADLFGAYSMMVPVFVGATPRWYCSSFGGRKASDGDNVSDKFWMIGVNQTTNDITAENRSWNMCHNHRNQTCLEFVFQDVFTSVVSEWNLVCSKMYVSELLTSVQMAGLGLGAALFAQTSDRFGRKKSYFMACVIVNISTLTSAFSVRWEMYAVCRFFVGLGYGAQMVVNCVYTVEFVGPRWRTLCGSLGFWPLGGITIGLWAYLVRDWRYLLIATSAPAALYLFSWPFLPESPRWLVQRRRFQEAHNILKTIAEKNKKPVPRISVLRAFYEKDKKEKGKLKNYSYWHLFTTWRYCRRALIVMVIWFTTVCIYYQLYYNVKNFSGNRYLNMLYSNVADLASLFFVICFTNIIGRKRSLILYYLITMAGNLVLLFVVVAGKKDDLSDLILASALIGKAAILTCFYVAQFFTAELFPTVIRNQGLGSASVAGRVGSVLSPQIIFLGYNYPLAPPIITTVMCLVALPLILTLPETTGEGLEDVFVVATVKHTQTNVMPADKETNISQEVMTADI